MIALSVQDAADGKGKVSELRSAIGQSFSYNKSTTSRAKLLAVSADGNVCTIKEVEAYNRKPKRTKYTAPSWLIWNAIFY